ncbi:MAG TPA: hypothetical protein PKW73_08040 [Candidatus Obscuribacter sp.]|nr:hypothetical protein [Candidatus Obscuribacter sp.]
MITLNQNQLVVSFPEVHEDAVLSLNFQRTLRIPDNDKVYPLPPGLGNFPLVHVDDYRDEVPKSWLEHGGIIMPMYQSEAMWILFSASFSALRSSAYPMAIKISTGKIDAVTGAPHTNGLHPHPQDYLVVPGQPWLDGYCVKKGMIRQFVAMPLGEGYTAEEQITHKAEHGGVQIVVYPMKAEAYERLFPKVEREIWGSRSTGGWGAPGSMPPPPGSAKMMMAAGGQAQSMGLAPGGRMKQEIYKDRFDINDWDTSKCSRCFVHIANSLTWREITGANPPHRPPTAVQYADYGLPWFDYYDENLKALSGSSKLANLKSVQALSQLKGEPIDNKPVNTGSTVKLGPGQVREGDF